MSDDLVKRLRAVSLDLGVQSTTRLDSDVIRQAANRIKELEAKLAMADKLASEFKNCLEVLTKEDGYVCCSGHQCGCYGASLHAQAIYYANEAIDDYHKTTGGKDD